MAGDAKKEQEEQVFELRRWEVTYIVDRIEGDFAVCECQETGDMVDIPKKLLPKGLREGRIIKKEGEVYTIDHEATKQRRKYMEEKTQKLFEKYKR